MQKDTIFTSAWASFLFLRQKVETFFSASANYCYEHTCQILLRTLWYVMSSFSSHILKSLCLWDPLLPAPEQRLTNPHSRRSDLSEWQLPTGGVHPIFLPGIGAGIAESKLSVGIVSQANTDNCWLHQQGMPASNTSHQHQQVLSDLC